MRRLLCVWLCVVGTMGSLLSLGQAVASTVSDEIICASMVDGLRVNTSEKARRTITGIASANMPQRLVVCSGEDPYIAGGLSLEYLNRIKERGWVIFFDDNFFSEAPDEIFRAVMAHEIAHLLLNKRCLDKNLTLHLRCEHEVDVFAGTLVGKCTIARSLDWLLAFKKRHASRVSGSHLQTLLTMLDPRQECGQEIPR